MVGWVGWVNGSKISGLITFMWSRDVFPAPRAYKDVTSPTPITAEKRLLEYWSHFPIHPNLNTAAPIPASQVSEAVQAKPYPTELN